MRVVVFGSGGQLGTEVVSVLSDLGHDVVGFTHSEVDIANFESVLKAVKDTNPEVVVNAAAYTDVDGCESNRDLAFKVNAIGARNVAVASSMAEAKVVHISTDYVFGGERSFPYTEFDTPSPINTYGASKLSGEIFVREQNRRFFILRTAWLYGIHGKNFLKTMISLAKKGGVLRVVNDQWGSPTWAKDVALQLEKLIGTHYYGVYHCTSQGKCTWFEFASEIFNLVGLDVEVVPVGSEEFPRPAKRPGWSVLDNYMLKLHDLDIMPHWKDALSSFVKTYREVLL